MSELRDYITSRREKLQRDYDAIQETAAPILAELQDLRRAELALIDKPKPGPRTRTLTGSDPHPDSIQGRVLTLLGSHPEGMTAGEITEGLAEMFGHLVARTSVAPQLSRLIGSGHLVRASGIYALTSESSHVE